MNEDEKASGAGEGSVPQPVAISQAVNALVIILASTTWFTVDNALLNGAITAVGIVTVVLTTLKARASVIAIR